MEIKYQSFLGGRVALSDSEGHIETTSCNQIKNNLRVLVSIRRTNAAYSTGEVFYETN